MSRADEPNASGFLGRWSRLKRKTQQDPALPSANEAQPPSKAQASDQATDGAQVSAAQETETELPLPSLDDITPGADVAAFFQKHVPETLRTAALRKLWVTDPTIKDFIEMADYQWDFTNPDSIPGWSSSLPGVDVKAMAERIFATAERTLAEPEGASDVLPAATAVEASNVQAAERASTTSESPDFSNVSQVTYDERPSAAPPALVEQVNADTSSAYSLVRKRHGGALPT
jgi:hypothetical protein